MNKKQFTHQDDGSFFLGFGNNEPILTRKSERKPVSKLNLDLAEIERIQRERNEMLINHFPIAAKQWGLV
jgi:hypothetical protein